MADDNTKNVKLNLDAAPVGRFAEQLNKAIEDGSIHEGGWKLSVDDSHIPIPGDYGHRSIVLRGPNGFYASIDTNNYNGKDTSLFAKAEHLVFPYATGTEMRMTTDLERKGNWVVTDANLLRSTTVLEGEGSAVILEFLRAAEQAKEFNTSGADYSLFSEDLPNKQRANSIAGPTQVLRELGYDVHKMGSNHDVDLTAEKFTANGKEYKMPGAAHQVHSLFPVKDKEFFEGYNGNPAAIFGDSKTKKIAIDLIEGLHPDVIAKDPDHQPAPVKAPVGGYKP